eukprot:4632270-Prorocentrum_lima.AAC.1
MRLLPLSFPEAPTVPGGSSGSGTQKRVRLIGKQAPRAVEDVAPVHSGREPSRRADYQASFGVLTRAIMAEQLSGGASQG